jgi:hypothetical protein
MAAGILVKSKYVLLLVKEIMVVKNNHIFVGLVPPTGG